MALFKPISQLCCQQCWCLLRACRVHLFLWRVQFHLVWQVCYSIIVDTAFTINFLIRHPSFQQLSRTTPYTCRVCSVKQRCSSLLPKKNSRTRNLVKFPEAGVVTEASEKAGYIFRGNGRKLGSHPTSMKVAYSVARDLVRYVLESSLFHPLQTPSSIFWTIGWNWECNWRIIYHILSMYPGALCEEHFFLNAPMICSFSLVLPYNVYQFWPRGFFDLLKRTHDCLGKRFTGLYIAYLDGSFEVFRGVIWSSFKGLQHAIELANLLRCNDGCFVGLGRHMTIDVRGFALSLVA